MKKKTDLPAMPFYVGDWLKCPEVRALPLDCKSLWFDLICYMWESTERGVMVKPNGKPYTDNEIVRMVGLDNNHTGGWLRVLIDNEICSRRADGAIYSRRMVKDEKIRQIRKETGKKGGNPRLLNQKDKQIAENETESKNEKRNYINEIIEVWKQSYFIERETEYEVVNIGQESSAAGKLATIYKRKYPNAKTEEALKGFEVYFRACLNIEDNWLNDHMSMSIIVSKFNEINTILKNGTKKRSKQPATSDQRLAQIIHAFFEPKKD